MPRAVETEKAHKYRLAEGFYEKFMRGAGLDIGFAGYVENPEPILKTATGVDIGYPGYDGVHLPFQDCSQDYVFAGHVLEHIVDYRAVLKEWHRVVKVGGHLILALPHQWLYEKERELPSFFCPDHKRFYTPASLFREIEESLKFNSYRIVHFRECDDGFCYAKGPKAAMDWWNERFEMELVLKKIEMPTWMDLF